MLIAINEYLSVSTDPNQDLEYAEDAPELNEQWWQGLAQGLMALQTHSCLKESDFLALCPMVDGRYFNEGLLVHNPPSFMLQELQEFIDTVSEQTNYGGEIWSTYENNIGEWIVDFLLEQGVEQVPRMLYFMMGCDLDHEVDHGAAFERAVELYGWRQETLAVWATRSGLCCGQHGQETEWNELTEQGLEEYLKANPNQISFLEELIAQNLIHFQSWNCYKKETAEHFILCLEDEAEIFYEKNAVEFLGEQGLDIVANAKQLAIDTINAIFAENNPPKRNFLKQYFSYY